MAFYVREPIGKETPVIVEVPHAGLHIDPLALATLVAPARCIGRDADLMVDQLYEDAPQLGATLLVAETSRYVCDLNRAESDVDAQAAHGGEATNAPHGLIWRRSTEGHPTLQTPLSEAELLRRLRDIYRPYHSQLLLLIEAKQNRFGYAILLCAHSMPSSGRTGHNDPGSGRADVVPGSRGRTTADGRIIDLGDRLARDRGWTVVHDVPYRGGFTTGHHGQPANGVHAVQVELNRRLYMDEDTLARLPRGFGDTQAYCRELVESLGAIDPRN